MEFVVSTVEQVAPLFQLDHYHWKTVLAAFSGISHIKSFGRKDTSSPNLTAQIVLTLNRLRTRYELTELCTYSRTKLAPLVNCNLEQVVMTQ